MTAHKRGRTLAQKCSSGAAHPHCRDIMTTRAFQNRKGFTLIETIVTVGLIAVLAAFVVPTVVQKAGVADPVKVSNDITSIRTGMEGFQSDIKGGYPNQIRILTETPTTLNHFID